MRPETEKNGPRPVSARPLPRAWARGPAADGRAAETARAARPLGLLLAWLAGGRPQTVGSNPTAGRQSRSSKTGGASPQTLTGHFFSPSPFLTPQRVEATPTAAGARERWWRRHGSLADVRRSPNERAAVEMAVDGAHVLDPGRVPRRRHDGVRRPGSCARADEQ